MRGRPRPSITCSASARLRPRRDVVCADAVAAEIANRHSMAQPIHQSPSCLTVAVYSLMAGSPFIRSSVEVPHDAERDARVILDICGSGRLRDPRVPDVGPCEECGVVINEDAAAERLAHSYVQSGAER